MSISVAPSLHPAITAHRTIPPRTLRNYKSQASLLGPIVQLVRHPVTSIGNVLGPVWASPEQDAAARVGLDKQTRREVLLQRMQDAIDLDTWRTSAEELDLIEGNNTWKEEPTSPLYDHELLQDRITELEEARISRDPARMLWLLRNSLTRSLGNMGDLQLYKYSHIGTKYLIEDYISTVGNTLETLLDCYQIVKSPLDSRHVYEELLRTRQYFGRSALLLSGGGTFGMTHSGVAKALWENNVLPRIISGSSAGSIVASVVCTRTDEELPETLYEFTRGDLEVFEKPDESSIFRRTVRMLTTRSIFDPQHLVRVMREWLGDMTFLEAYNRTLRILNISVSSTSMNELPRLMNYITAPNVVIWSAVVASCSVPLFFSPTTIVAKDPKTGEIGPWNPSQLYIDGSVDNDLPMTRLAEMFNVNHFIVSQVNPHVIPFLDGDVNSVSGGVDYPNQTHADAPSMWRALGGMAKGEMIHRMHQLSEFGVFPTTLTKFRSVLSQKYSGDITILPEISLSMVPRVLQNPDTDFMEQALLSGERATWPKLSRIQNHLAIEVAIDKAIQKARTTLAFSPSQVQLRMLSLCSTKHGRIARPQIGRQFTDSRANTRSWCAEPSMSLSQLTPRFIPTNKQNMKEFEQAVSTEDDCEPDTEDEDRHGLFLNLSRSRRTQQPNPSSSEGPYDSNTSNIRSYTPSPTDSPEQIPPPPQLPVGYFSQPITTLVGRCRRSSPDLPTPTISTARSMIEEPVSGTADISEAERKYRRLFHGGGSGKVQGMKETQHD